jgi:amino acid adenylation domain-containing protein
MRLGLSPVQYGMLLHGLSAPGDGVNVLQILVTLRHDLDPGLFERAVQTLVAARPALRTTFWLEDPEGPSQSVLDHVDVAVPVHDWRSMDEPARSVRWREYLDADKARSFDFAERPPSRFALIRTGEHGYELVWTCHHALLDGRSCATVVAELFALYDGLAAGRPVELPDRRPYHEFIHWLSEQDLAPAATFWRDRLAGVRVPTPLGVDQVRPLPPGEPGFGTVFTSLTEELTTRLYTLARDGQVTPNNMVQAAWAVLLRQLSGESDVLFGTARAGRSFAVDAPEMIGLFLNTVPFRVAVADDTTVRQVLTRLRADQVALREHEFCAPAQIREWTEIPAGSALFDSIVVFENYQYDTYFRGLDPSWHQRYVRFEEQSGYTFALSGYRDTRLDLKLGYHRRRVEDGLAARMLAHVRILLEAMVAAPDTPLGQLPMFPSVVPFDLPRRRAANPLSRHRDVTVPVPAELAGDPDRIRDGVLAFLARLADDTGRDIALDGSLLRLPELTAGQDFADFRERLDVGSGYPADGLPVAVELVADPDTPAQPPTGTSVLVRIGRRGDACRLLVADDLLVHDAAGTIGAGLTSWLRALAGRSGADLTELSVLAPSDRHRVVVGWNDTAVQRPDPACVHDLINRQARRRPDAPAVVFDGHTVSYAELDRAADRLAVSLRGQGIGRGSLVGVRLDRSADLVIALLGVLKAGAAYVPLDPIYPPDRIEYMIKESGLALVLTEASVAAGEVTAASDPEPVTDRSASDRDASDGGDLAYVIYTSGSTGRPKGVRITHGNLANLLSAMAGTPGLTERDTLLAVTTMCFDIAYLELFLPLTVGGTVEVAPAPVAADGFRLRERIEQSRPTVMQATPATWRMLITAGWPGDSRLRALCGGEALPRDLADDLLARCGEVWNLYGPTETTIWSSTAAVERLSPITIGRPIDNTRYFVLDRWRQPVLPGLPGELYIGGAGVGRGYLGNPELTEQRFGPGPDGDPVYRTGDLVRQLPDGQLEYLDRLDHQIKIHGYRVEPGEIEVVLREHAAVADAVVVPDSQRLVGYLVPADPGVPPSTVELRQHLSTRLPHYMVPGVFMVVPDLPRTPNGKIDRRALPTPNPAEQTGGGPRTRIERTVAGVWRGVLGVDRVGIDDNFFDAGGNSVLLMRVVAALRSAVDGSLTTVDMFTYPTVRAMAEYLARLDGRTGGEPAAVPAPERSPGRAAIHELRHRRRARR